MHNPMKAVASGQFNGSFLFSLMQADVPLVSNSELFPAGQTRFLQSFADLKLCLNVLLHCAEEG